MIFSNISACKSCENNCSRLESIDRSDDVVYGVSTATPLPANLPATAKNTKTNPVFCPASQCDEMTRTRVRSVTKPHAFHNVTASYFRIVNDYEISKKNSNANAKHLYALYGYAIRRKSAN